MGVVLCLSEEHIPFPPTLPLSVQHSDYCVPKSLVRQVDVNIPILLLETEVQIV